MRAKVFRPLLSLVLLLGLGGAGQAANWNGIEPFVTDLDQVHVKLGKPLKETAAGPVYNYDWGTVSVVVITDQEVASRKYKDRFKGKVRGLVIDLRGSNLTPLALGLLSNAEYEKQTGGGGVYFVNGAAGITYKFVNDKLSSILYEGAPDLRKKAEGK